MVRKIIRCEDLINYYLCYLCKMSDSDERYFMSSAARSYIILQQNRTRKRRRFARHYVNKLRLRESEYVVVYQKFKGDDDEQKFFEYMRMTKSTCQYIIDNIRKYDLREYRNCHLGREVCMEEKLVITIQ